MKQKETVWVLPALIGVYLLIAGGMAFFLDIRILVLYLPDDAAYYFKIAENYCRGLGFSFDVMHQTNGYQPLWLYVLIPVKMLLPFRPETMFRCYLFLQAILLSSACLLLWRAQMRHFDRTIALFSCLLFLLISFFQFMTGMESALLALLFIICFTVFTRPINPAFPSPWRDFFSGCFLGLLFLVRLDFVFFIFFYFILFLKQAETCREILHRAARTCSGIGIFIVPYLMYNLKYFGRINPVSGVLKSSFPHFHVNMDFCFSVQELLVVFAAVGLAACYLFGVFVKKRKKSESSETDNLQLKHFVTAAALSVLLHFCYYVFFTKWTHYAWQFASYNLFLVIVLPVLFRRQIGNLPAVVHKLFPVVVLLCAGLFAGTKIYGRLHVNLERNWHGISYKAAMNSKQFIHNGDVVAMADAGIFSYFGDYTVINIDGLVNDFEFQNIIRRGEVNNYFRSCKVSYLAIMDTVGYLTGDNSSNIYRLYSYMYGCYSDSIILQNADIVLNYRYNNNKTSFIIWKVKK